MGPIDTRSMGLNCKKIQHLAKGKGEIERMFSWRTYRVLANGFKAGELIWPSVALSRALLGQWSNVGSLGRVYVIIVDTFEEKKESGHHRKYGFYSPLSTVNFNSSKICQFSFILRTLLNKIY